MGQHCEFRTIEEQNDSLRNDICMVHMAGLQGLETLNGTFRITMQQRTMDGGLSVLLKCI